MSVVLVFVLIAAVGNARGLTTDEQNQINAGLEMGKAVAELLENKQFTRSLTKIATSIGPYLGAIGPFAGLVMAFIPVEDPVMDKLNEIMANIDNKFDRLDNRFNDIERLIDWNAVKINFGQIEQNIITMMQRYKYIYNAPKSARPDARMVFLNNYPSTFENAATKLYQSIVYRQSQVNEDLTTAAMKYTKYNRRQLQEFLMGVMKLYLQAVKIELTSYALDRRSQSYINYMKGTLQNHVQQVRNKFEAADRICRDSYHAQLAKDVDEYSANRPKSSQSNKDFVKGLFQLLAGKYYWRNWLVVAYNDIWGGDNHWISQCSGYHRFRSHGRNFVVASKDNNAGIMDLARAERDMRTVAMTERKGNWFTGYYYRRRSAHSIYNSLNKSGACSTGVIKCGQELWYYYHTKRFKYVNRCPHFNLHMWG